MTLIKRHLLPVIEDHLTKPEITLIVGARQVGKTTLMRQLAAQLQQQGKKTLFLNLDYESDFTFVESQEKLLQKIKLEFGDAAGFVFLDEIQRKVNAGLYLKGLFDQGAPYKFIISGSGSMELKGKIHESLVGRKRVFELSTITLQEFFQFKTKYAYEDRLSHFFELENHKVDLLLREYMTFGGYPRIVLESQHQEKVLLMNEIYDSYLKKDIVYLLKLDRPDVFTKLIRLCANSCGSILNYSTLAADAGLSGPTLKKYLWYAEGTFVIKIVPPFYRNKRKEIKKSPTIYFTDLGLRNFALHQFGQDPLGMNSGRLFQNLVYLILTQALRDKMYSIYFWRTSDQAEVDFVLEGAKRLVPIEVKFSHLKRDSMSRSLRSFIDAYHPDIAYVVNISYRNEIRQDGTIVKFVPFYDLYREEF